MVANSSKKGENNSDPLRGELLKIFVGKYGADFEGEGHVGYGNEMYLVKKDGSYRRYVTEELPRR